MIQSALSLLLASVSLLVVHNVKPSAGSTIVQNLSWQPIPGHNFVTACIPAYSKKWHTTPTPQPNPPFRNPTSTITAKPTNAQEAQALGLPFTKRQKNKKKNTDFV